MKSYLTEWLIARGTTPVCLSEWDMLCAPSAMLTARDKGYLSSHIKGIYTPSTFFISDKGIAFLKEKTDE